MIMDSNNIIFAHGQRIDTTAKPKPRKKKPRKLATLQKPRFPYTSLFGTPVIEPILDGETRNQVVEAITSFTHKVRWEKWGMPDIAANAGAILLEGPSGTGKTTIARWLAKKVSGGIIEITMADVGGSDPGQTERGIRDIFTEAKRQGNATIFVDECDGILWSREKAGPDSMWMLAVVNEFLMQIERYEGLCILATNMAHLLDPALLRRLRAVIRVSVPPSDVRRKLWEAKMPLTFPLEPTEQQFRTLSRYVLTGALVEKAIIREAQVALREGRHPKFESLCNIAKSMEIK